MKKVKLILYSKKSKNQLHDKDSTKKCMKNFQTEYIIDLEGSHQDRFNIEDCLLLLIFFQVCISI